MLINKTFIISTHYYAFGVSQALRDYLLKNKYYVLYIEHPLFSNPIKWGVGLIDTFWQVVKTGKKYDVYVGSNRLNAFIGIILKSIRRVNKVVYYSPDWVENRFNNHFLNSVYQQLDYFCVKYSDKIWNSAIPTKIDPMMKKRLELGYPKNLLNKQTQLPDGAILGNDLPFRKRERYSIGFIGHLRKGMGVEFLIDVFDQAQKILPNLTLYILGSGELENSLREKAKNNKQIVFSGYLNIDEVYRILSKCMIAVAPYEPGSISEFTDPAKVKVYLALGLPVVITPVPQLAREIAEKNCGIVSEFKTEKFKEAIIKLMSNESLLKKSIENSLQLAKKYSWDNIFTKAIKAL